MKAFLLKYWFVILLILGIAGYFIWRSTAVDDTQTQKVLTSAVSTQKTVDTTAVKTIAAATKTNKKANKTLDKSLAAATTVADQVGLINKSAGTDIVVSPPSGQNPSDSSVEVKSEDVEKIATQSVDFEKCQNDLKLAQVVEGQQSNEITARDTTIQAYDKEVAALKGGSRLKRFLKAAKNDAIVAGIGVGAGILIDKKVK